jgi:hypothetical protein
MTRLRGTLPLVVSAVDSAALIRLTIRDACGRS